MPPIYSATLACSDGRVTATDSLNSVTYNGSEFTFEEDGGGQHVFADAAKAKEYAASFDGDEYGAEIVVEELIAFREDAKKILEQHRDENALGLVLTLARVAK